MATEKLKPMIVIVGPTGTGKSHWAMELARKFDGEIICADARTVYKGMDIGTAKPSAKDQAEIPHHLLDVVEPNEQFTAAQFKALADAAIKDIIKRGKLPIMVGGTGLYVDAVLYDYHFRAPADESIREELSGLSVEELQARIKKRKLQLPENDRNPRHLIRVLETGGEQPVRAPLRKNTLIFGLTAERKILEPRVRARVNAMIEQGLEAEVKALQKKFGWDVPGMNAIGYREFAAGLDIEQTTALIIRDTLQYAKRQRTWFKRNKSIQWLNDPSRIVDFATTILNK